MLICICLTFELPIFFQFTSQTTTSLMHPGPTKQTNDVIIDHIFPVNNTNKPFCKHLTIFSLILHCFSSNLFSYLCFLSHRQMIHVTAGERGSHFSHLYHFLSLKNIQSITCSFSTDKTISYFQLQQMQLLDCNLMKLIHLWE